jgi:hypothetical protein
LPRFAAGQLLHHRFRACTAFTICYSRQTWQVAYATLCTRGFSSFVASTTAPIATGCERTSSRAGFYPLWTGALFPAHAKAGAMASTGIGRGVIYTAKDYSRYRLMFTMRHISGDPDQQACVLIFCSRPQAREKPLDALGGIQFQVPNGGHRDYRRGMHNPGGQEFTSVTKTRFDVHAWSRVEILGGRRQRKGSHGCRSAAWRQGR